MEPRDHYPEVLDRLGAAIVIANLADFRGWTVLGLLDAIVQDAHD